MGGDRTGGIEPDADPSPQPSTDVVLQGKLEKDGAVVNGVLDCPTPKPVTGRRPAAPCPHRADSQQVGGFSGGEHEPVAASPVERAGAVLVGCPPNGTTAVTAMTSRHRLDYLEGEDSAQVLVRFGRPKVSRKLCIWQVISATSVSWSKRRMAACRAVAVSGRKAPSCTGLKLLLRGRNGAVSPRCNPIATRGVTELSVLSEIASEREKRPGR